MKQVVTITWSVVWFVAVASPSVLGQEMNVSVQSSQPPHYVGLDSVIQLTIDGVKADPQPEVRILSKPDEVSLGPPEVGTNSSIQIVRSGDRIRRIEQVSFRVRFRVIAKQPGEYTIGPFVVAQNGTEKKVDAITMSFQDIPESDDMKIKVIAPQGAIYPDQRVPVKVEWWFSGSIDNVRQLNIDVPLFDAFRFEADPPAQRGRTRLPIRTNAGTLALNATSREEVDGEKRFRVISAERTMIPDRPGTFEVAPAAVVVERVTAWRQNRGGFGGSLLDDFMSGGRRPSQVELIRASGEPMTLTVMPFPDVGKPASFTGTVGKGFSIDVAADRTVVRVGDPIRLSIQLRGDGNIGGASLPPLSADGGMDPQRFRLPDGDVAGQVDGESKRFSVTIRVTDESVNEIPSIAYSWFDAERELYQTARSSPIALRVMPADVVGADAVVSMAPSLPETDETDAAAVSSVSGEKRFTLSGADLSIPSDPDSLLATHSTGFHRTSIQISGYALGSCLVAIALYRRRQKNVDPEQQRRLHLAKVQGDRIRAAKHLSADQASREIAAAIQRCVAEMTPDQRALAEDLMARCDSIAFQPDNAAASPIDAKIVDQALAVVQSLFKQREAS